MKKLALSLAICASFVSSAALAANQRPTYMAFSAPKPVAAPVNVVPVAPKVAKNDEGFGTIPLYIPLIGIVAIVGFIAAVSGGGSNGSPG